MIPNFYKLKYNFWRYEKILVYISYYVLYYFTSYFAQYLKISLADIRYLLLWCVTYLKQNKEQGSYLFD